MIRTLVMPLAGLGLFALSAAGAAAAAPDYCALYAREVARLSADADTVAALQRAQDQAFYKCLNMDEDPPLPDESAYADDGGDGAMVGEGDAMVGDEVVEPAPAPKPAPTRTATFKGSGLKRWSAEWKAWCAEHYPNSFDPKTGTVLPYDGKRTMCP